MQSVCREVYFNGLLMGTTKCMIGICWQNHNYIISVVFLEKPRVHSIHLSFLIYSHQICYCPSHRNDVIMILPTNFNHAFGSAHQQSIEIHFPLYTFPLSMNSHSRHQMHELRTFMSCSNISSPSKSILDPGGKQASHVFNSLQSKLLKVFI